jgi:L-aminopeptidase/D-esterase-like protein
MPKVTLRNLITDVPGLTVGNAGRRNLLSGVTVVLPDQRAAAAVSVMGGAPGPRDRPARSVLHARRVGGSCWRAAAKRSMTRAASWMAHAASRGFRSSAIVPIVPAILFDLLSSGDRTGARRRFAFLAITPSTGLADFAGRAGAGLGCTAGQLKGGLGGASARRPKAGRWGHSSRSLPSSVLLPGTAFWAAPFERDGGFGAARPLPLPDPLNSCGKAGVPPIPRSRWWRRRRVGQGRAGAPWR